MRDPCLDLLNAIAQTIYDKKGRNIIAIDVREISSMTDYFLIAEGNVERHILAISDAVDEKIKESQYTLYHIDASGGWVVMDCQDILIHLFLPELREKYALEELWQEGKLVDLTIKIKET